MLQNFFSEIIERKPALFHAVLAFNGLLESPLIPEELQSVGVNIAAVWAVPSVRRLWKTPPADTFWDFSEEPRRLALLPPALLSELAQTFGIAVHAEEMAKLIDGAQSAELRREMGPELYTYALERGRYQLGQCADIFRSLDTHLSLFQRSALHGGQALALLYSKWPDSLQRKVRLPAAETEAVPLPAFPDDAAKALWFGMKKILLKEVAPEWAPCFN